MTDESNACRTLLFNVSKLAWSDELLNFFSIPKQVLPVVRPSRSEFGELRKEICGFEVPVTAVCGDQQSAWYAAAKTDSGKAVAKTTFGTGTFTLFGPLPRFVIKPGFFTTLSPNPNGDGSCLTLEAKINSGARTVDKLLDNPKKLDAFLKQLATQVIEEHISKLSPKPKELVIDGGVSRDGIVGGYLAEISGIKVRPLKTFDGTALGAALLVFDSAGVKAK